LENELLVKVGEPTELTEKFKNLYYLLEELKPSRHRIEYIDLRASFAPAVKFKN
jgi:hypothetical protein